MELATWRDRFERAPDEYERLRLLTEGLPKFSAKAGRKENWPSPYEVETVRARVAAVRTTAEEIAQTSTEATVRRLAWEIARFTFREADERRRSGRLEFHDLLVLARAVLRDPQHGWEVRRRLRARYTRLLLDEFQDTDPIQCDLAALLASDDPEARDRRWDDIAVDPGRLFVVGDPKQSIYRFRRADIAAFLRARSAFGATPRHLTRNFRTTRQVIEFVNHVFRDLIVAEPESQPEYVALVPDRGNAPLQPGPVLLGVVPHDDAPRADALREREAAEVAAAVSTALREGWSVSRREPGSQVPGVEGSVWEPCHLGDIAILLPARTSLGHLEDALDAAGIPYRAETSSLVYGTREIRDLLLVLQAVDDPTDELSLVSALRSPLFGCGDDDLYTFRIGHGGRWNHQAPLPESLPRDHAVGEAMRALAAWHDARLWLGPSELLDRIVRERRVLEVGFAHGRPRDLWRRVRFVIDQARAFSEAQSGSLRDFLRWADLQSAEGARVVETVLPETDDDAVRILTIHGAKGLEFPIVIVSGMTTGVRRRRSGVELLFPHDSDTYALRVSSRVTTEEFERYQPIDEQMDFHEKLRLLYVALTRARDHLVVSVHRTTREPDSSDRTKWTHAELLWSAARDAPHWSELVPARRSGTEPARDVADAVPFPAWNEWAAERAAALAHGARPRVWSATAIATAAAARADPGLAKDARDLELPPWNKGRYGTAVGSAVHAVLQTVDLVTGEGVDETAAAQAAAEGVIGRERDIAALARQRARVGHGPRGRRHPRLPARDVRRDASERAHARGLRRPRLPDAARGSSSSTTRPTRGATSWSSTTRSRAIGSRARRTPSHSKRPPVRRSRAACSCSSPPTAPGSGRSLTFRRRSRRYEQFSRGPPDPREHEHSTDRAREHHQRGVPPGPPDVRPDEHGHRDECHPHETVEEAHEGLGHVVGRDDPEVEQHEVREGLEERDHGQGLGLSLELAARVVGEVGHGCEGTLCTRDRDHQQTRRGARARSRRHRWRRPRPLRALLPQGGRRACLRHGRGDRSALRQEVGAHP